MSNWWLLIALLSIRTNELIKAVDGIKLEEYREYVALVSDVQDHFKISSVFIAYPGKDENLETTTLMVHLMRQFSGNRVLSLTLTYTSLPDRPHHGHITRPLYVVLLDTAEHLERFRQVTSRCEMSYPFWLLIFTRPRPEICGAKIDSNFFHLRFDSEMLVKCHGSNTLMEWYAFHENRTNVEDLATWDVHAGLTLKSIANVYARRRDLQGKLMHIATIRESRFIERNGLTTSDFISIIFSELSARLNFTINVAYEENVYGMYNESTGKWSGVIGRLHANEVDFGVAEFSMTRERLDVVDFTLPIMLSHNQLYMKEPDGSYFQWDAYFRVYDMNVWIVMELIYISTSLMVTFIRIKVKEKPLSPDHISENYLNVWGIYCQQGMPNFPTASPMRIAYFSIFLSSIFLLGIYAACLISYLTLNNPSLSFSGLEGFASDGSYKLITIKESSDYSFFSACNDKVAFFASAAVKSQISARIPCDLVFVETGKIDSLGMALKKNSQYTKLINHHLHKFRDMGIMTRLRSKVYVKVNPVENKYIPVSFKGVLPILVILCIGALLCLFILTAEIVTHRLQMAKQNRKFSQSIHTPEF